MKKKKHTTTSVVVSSMEILGQNFVERVFSSKLSFFVTRNFRSSFLPIPTGNYL